MSAADAQFEKEWMAQTEIRDYRNWLISQLAAERQKREQAERQLAELKRGLRNNNTDFELAFLDAYLDEFKTLRQLLSLADKVIVEYTDHFGPPTRSCKDATAEYFRAAKAAGQEKK